jgi:adenylosuccinate lyase
MKELWSKQAKYKRWLEIELVVAEVMEELGEIPNVSTKLREKAKIDLKRIEEIESLWGHDFLAFLQAVEESIGEEGRFLHKGLTSYDVEDTALALAMRDALDILIKEVKDLVYILKSKAGKHKYTLMAGRTHGMHAEPITFGLKLLLWHYEMERNLKRLEDAKGVISYGKISGSVGTYANVSPEVERRVCERLGLKPAKISTQIIQRDRHAQALSALAILGATLEKMAVELRNLQRTEIAEVLDRLSHGSSSMPHKQNPIAAETISGLARILRANLQAALENIALWHERDISHSSVERIIIPDSFLVAHYMLLRMKRLLENLQVNEEKMKENLKLSQGLIFSQAVLLKLVEKGMSRGKAHELVRSLAMKVDKQKSFKELLFKDEEIGKFLTPQEIEEIFDYSYHLREVDKIFARFQ